MSDPAQSPTNEGNVKEKPVTIEEAARKLKAPAWAAAALKARKGWPIGKSVLLSEYEKELTDLLKGPTEPKEPKDQTKGGNA